MKPVSNLLLLASLISLSGCATTPPESNPLGYSPLASAAVKNDLVAVQRLLDEGADPGKIPVEVQSDIEFVINLKTAKALGIEIPRVVLYQANRIIR